MAGGGGGGGSSSFLQPRQTNGKSEMWVIVKARRGFPIEVQGFSTLYMIIVGCRTKVLTRTPELDIVSSSVANTYLI